MIVIENEMEPERKFFLLENPLFNYFFLVVDTFIINMFDIFVWFL
jgi:hypothetical protein